MELVRWVGGRTVSELPEDCQRFGRFERWCKVLRPSDERDVMNRFLPPLDVVMV